MILYQCLDLNCNEREILLGVPGQKLECDPEGCRVDLLTGRAAWQIEILLGEKTLVSPPFEKEGFYSTYLLKISDDDLDVVLLSAKARVEPTSGNKPVSYKSFWYLTDLLTAGLWTLEIELPLAFFNPASFQIRIQEHPLGLIKEFNHHPDCMVVFSDSY